MLDAVFRARRRKRPKRFIEVDFGPAQFRNFAQPLAGQDQKLDAPGIDRLQRVRGLPDGFQLVIGQNPVPRRLDRRRLDCGDWRDIKDAALDREVAQPLELA